jgi:dTDP-4-dehydrorhamnose reductase
MAFIPSFTSPNPVLDTKLAEDILEFFKIETEYELYNLSQAGDIVTVDVTCDFFDDIKQNQMKRELAISKANQFKDKFSNFLTAIYNIPSMSIAGVQNNPVEAQFAVNFIFSNKQDHVSEKYDPKVKSLVEKVLEQFKK